VIGGYSHLGGYYGKREAEADAEPLILGAGYSGLGLGYAGAAIAAPAIATHAYAAPIAVGKSAPCVNAANIPVPCNAGAVLAAPAIATPAIAHAGVIGGYSHLGGYYGKREAEADAEPLILGAGYSGLGLGYAGAAIAAPLATATYAAPIAVGKSAPCVNAANIPVPCNAGAVLAAPAIAAPLAHAGVIGGYSTLGGYYGKREAEAEPYLGYAGLGYAGLGYGYAGAYGYGKSAPCVNAANIPVPCRGFY